MIRRATLADHGWIAAVAADVYGDLGDYGTIIRSWLGHPGVLTYVDEQDGAGEPDSPAARGFLLLGFYEPTDGPIGRHVADLLAIGVDRAHQRRGIGTRLLEYAIHLAALGQQHARAGARADEMRLTVAATNEVGRSFFGRFGFRVLDENHGHYDGGQRAIRMSRQLP